MHILKSKRQSTDVNEKCTTFRISQFAESSYRREASSRAPFQDRRNRLNESSSKTILKLATKKNIIPSGRLLRNGSTAIQAISKLIKINSSEYSELIYQEIEGGRGRSAAGRQGNCVEVLGQVFKLAQHMYQQVYSYRQIQCSIGDLHILIKRLGSATLTYRAFAFSGFVFFEYGSYSLSLYYFDRALKSFYDREGLISFGFERQLEMQLYKFVCRIFLIKGRYTEAKNFAYKLLRKAWIASDVDEEMAAHDLLGKVYMEMQNMPMCQYFHWRMRSGQKQRPQILAMSKQEMQKQGRQRLQFVCYQTINIFVDKDAKINDILQNHYRVCSDQYAKQTGLPELQNRTVYVYTHHSPNRLLVNYHLLQRKMIEAKQSKQLHFIRPKDSHRLKKLFSDFSALTHEIIQRLNSASYFPTEFTIEEDSLTELGKEK